MLPAGSIRGAVDLVGDTLSTPEFVVSPSRPGAYRTIAAALAAAEGSVVLRVEPGTYEGQLSVRDRTVVVRAADGPGTVTLETRDGSPVVHAERAHVGLVDVVVTSHGRNASTTVDVTGGALELAGCAITWQAGNGVIVRAGASATVTGCRFDGAGHGMGFIDSGGLVDGCDFTGDTLCGVSSKADSAPEVRNCTFRDVEYGFMAFQGAGGTIEDCEFTGVGNVAIGAGGGSAPTVRRCRVTGGSGSGVFIGASSGGSVEDCVFTDVGGYGIALGTTGAPEVRRCRVERSGQHGLFIQDGRARVEDVVVDNTPGYAVLILNGDHVLVDVSVTGGKIGIAVTGEEARLRLVGGSVRDATEHGLLIVAAAEATVERSTVSSPGIAVAAAESARVTLTGCALSGGTHGVSAGYESRIGLDRCTIADSADSAVVLRDSAAFHATATTLLRCAGAGVESDSIGEATLDGCDLTGVAGEPVAGPRGGAVVVRAA
jgi:hypothetical protein